MLSAVILSEHSYPAMPLAWQPEHQRFGRPFHAVPPDH